MQEDLTVSIEVNGQAHRHDTPARRLLADFLREDCSLPGTRLGCEHGVCGACTVLLDGEPVRSCLMLAAQADGCSLTTVEGLARGDDLTPVQEAFRANHGLQCGFCTAGILISATGLLAETPEPTTEQIIDTIGGHVCRCTGYETIVDSVADAAGGRP